MVHRPAPASVVILTKLPGHLPVKSRLVPVLGEQGARELHATMLRRTVELVRSGGWEPVLAYSPPDADAHAALPGFSDCTFRPVAGVDGGVCLENALADADADAHEPGTPLLALGVDAPDLPERRLHDALAAIAEGRDAVLVPTGDGGFSCLCLRRPVRGLAQGFVYGSGDSLSSLMGWLGERGLSVALLDPWPDVDTPEDLAAYRRRCGEA